MRQADKNISSKLGQMLAACFQPCQLMIIFMILLSAFAVVFNSYQSRQLFHQLQTLQREVGSLQEEWRQLLVEEGAFSSHMLVEKKAAEELGMQVPLAADTITVIVQ